MSEQEELRERVERLEELLGQIAEKVGVSVTRQGPQPVVEPPPVFEAPPPVMQVEPVLPQEPTPVAPAVKVKLIPAEPQVRESFEQRVGKKLLPIVGAVVVIAAIAFLVALMLSRGWITLQMQFGGELLIGLTFLAIGVRKVNEKENFGQILIGIGLSGLYLSFAGAHVYKGLISSTMLVVLFFVVSLASYGMAWWRSSKPFMFLGWLGAMSAALMPLAESKSDLHIVLHGLAIIPVWFLLARHRWESEAIVVWILSSFLSVPFLYPGATGTTNPWFGVVAFWVYQTVGGHVTLRSCAPESNQCRELSTIGLLASIALPLGVVPATHGTAGFLGALAAAGFAGALSRVWLQEAPRKWLATAAYVTAFVASPVALVPEWACFVYGASSLALAVASRRGVDKVTAGLSMALCGLGIGAYTIWVSTANSGQLPEQVGAIVLLMAAMATVAAVAVPVKDCHVAVLPAGIVIWVLTIRLFYLTVGPKVGPYEAGIWATFVFSAASALLSGTLRFKTLLALSSVAGTVGVWAMWTRVGMAAQNVQLVELPLLAASVALGLLLIRACFQATPDSRIASSTTVIALTSISVCRILWIFVLPSYDPHTAAILSMAWTAGLLTLLGVLSKWPSVTWLAVATLGLSVVPFGFMTTESGQMVRGWVRLHEVSADGQLLAIVAFVGWALARCYKPRTEQVVAAIGLPVGVLVCRLAYLGFVWPPFNLQNVFVCEVATVLTGVAVALLAWRMKWLTLAATSLGSLSVALALYPPMKLANLGLVIPLRTVTSAQDIFVLAILGVYVLVLAKALVTSGASKISVEHVTIVLQWPLSAGLLMLVLYQPPFTLKFDASMSVAWTVYGTVLMALGFARQDSVLRTWALAVFGATLVKVIAYDLAFLDPVIRVIVLFGLGIVMLGGGYLYIRTQKGKEPLVP